MILIKVDLPAPFSPSSAWISPVRSVSDTSWRACVEPKRLLTPRVARIGGRPEASPSSGDVEAAAGLLGSRSDASLMALAQRSWRSLAVNAWSVVVAGSLDRAGHAFTIYRRSGSSTGTSPAAE